MDLLNSPAKASPAFPTPPEEARLRLESGAEPIPGYRLLGCLSRTAVSENWVVQTPDGRQRLARVIQGFVNTPSGDPLLRVLGLVDPCLSAMQLAHREPGRAVLLSTLPDATLKDRLAECQARQLPGLSRDDLLGWFEAVARTLDTQARRHSVFHLNLNPTNLVLEAGQIKLAELGLAHWLWAPAGQPLAHLNLRYSAPELFEGELGPGCDQYSLALTYCELLTGAHPLHGQPRPRTHKDRFRCRPDLRLAPLTDREVLQRALHPDPRKRYPSCLEMVQALANATEANVAEPAVAPSRPSAWPSLVVWPPDPLTPASGTTLEEVIARLLAGAVGSLQLGTSEQLHYVLQPGELLEHRCAARLPPGVARLKLEGFARAWEATVRGSSDTHFSLRIGLPASLWQLCTGSQPGLEMRVQFLPQRRATALTEVNVTLRPVGCAPDQAKKALAGVAVAALDSLRQFLQACPEQRRGQRLTWNHEVRVCQVPDDVSPPRAIRGRAKDLSPTGVGLVLPVAPTAARAYVTFDVPEMESLAVLARIVRVRPLPDGQFEVGARFAGVDESSQSM